MIMAICTQCSMLFIMFMFRVYKIKTTETCTYRHQIVSAQLGHMQHVFHAAIALLVGRVVEQSVFAPPGDSRCRKSAVRNAGDVERGALAVRSDDAVLVRSAHVIENSDLSWWNCTPNGAMNHI